MLPLGLSSSVLAYQLTCLLSFQTCFWTLLPSISVAEVVLHGLLFPHCLCLCQSRNVYWNSRVCWLFSRLAQSFARSAGIQVQPVQRWSTYPALAGDFTVPSSLNLPKIPAHFPWLGEASYSPRRKNPDSAGRVSKHSLPYLKSSTDKC